MISVLLSAVVLLQPVEPNASHVDLNDLSWLEGCWEGEGFGSSIMECWMSAPDGTLTGMFQMVDENGAQTFSEIFVIAAYETGPAMRLKHFNPDMTSWEAQDDYVNFTLLETSSAVARFEGITYSLVNPTRIEVEMRVQQGEGDPVTMQLWYERSE